MDGNINHWQRRQTRNAPTLLEIFEEKSIKGWKPKTRPSQLTFMVQEIMK
jgi:hypothetical protein